MNNRVPLVAVLGLLLVGAVLGMFAAIDMHLIDPPYLLNHSNCVRVSHTEAASLYRCSAPVEVR